MALDRRLPLIQSSLKMLVNELRAQDRISIVTYAGASEVLLSSASGADKARIISAINDLNADGGTNGGAGLLMAYEEAKKGLSKAALTASCWRRTATLTSGWTIRRTSRRW